MCGIFAYLGKRNAVALCIEGLKRLEYRGYDSAGLAGIRQSKLQIIKTHGKVADLETLVKANDLELDGAIAHTRWATHGRPSTVNAHPHADQSAQLAVVHNGIIENYDSLREELMEKGYKFRSETDTEVIAQLIASCYRGNVRQAVQEAIVRLSGAFAIAVIHRDHPGEIVVASVQSPLAIGLGNDELFVASDTNAFLVHTRNVIYLHNGEVAELTAKNQRVYDQEAQQVVKTPEQLSHNIDAISKKGYAHFMLKEVYEQPQTVRNALLARYVEAKATASFDELAPIADILGEVEHVLILACGTSWHAGFSAALLLEAKARIPTQLEISSEYRYRNPIVHEKTLVLAISQSGETADTLAAVRELKAKGALIVGVCNVQGSTLTREADATIFLRAGPEIGVASTKAYTSQLVVLSLFSIMMARLRDLSYTEGSELLEALRLMPGTVERVLAQAEHIRDLAERYAHYDNFFYLGRRYMLPAAYEGALKLKEISYINANAYAAGEMKHGPIALIDEKCPSVVFCTDSGILEKMRSNIQEIKARSGRVLALCEEGDIETARLADDVIFLPRCRDELACIPVAVAGQLFAYYVALMRNAPIDQPRNLAKSVTVE